MLVMPGLIGLGLAALAAAVLLWAGGRRGVPLALGAGYALGHAAVRGWLGEVRPPVPPVDATDWIAWLALAAMAWGMVEASRPVPFLARWVARLMLTGAVLALILGPVARNAWPWPEAAARLIGPGAGLLVVWGLLDALADRLGRRALSPLAIVAGGSALVLALSGSLVLGELGGVLTAGVVVARIGSWRDPAQTPARGLVPVVVVVLAGLLLAGHAYAETPTAAALLLGLAPLAAWADRLGPARRLSGWPSALVRASAVALPVGLAVALAASTAPEPPEGVSARAGASSGQTRRVRPPWNPPNRQPKVVADPLGDDNSPESPRLGGPMAEDAPPRPGEPGGGRLSPGRSCDLASNRGSLTSRTVRGATSPLL